MTAHASLPGPFLKALPCILIAALAAVPASAAPRHDREAIYSSPEAVRSAQEILAGMEYLAPGAYQSGRLDRETAAALRSFQRDHFLNATGALDAETMGLLTTHAPRTRIAGAAPAPPVATAAAAAAGSGPAGEPVGVAQADPAPVFAHDDGPVGREMPATASPIAALAALGTLLVAGGAALLRGRRG